ncbi:AsnC family transcriptional regulator [Streptomyces roseolilacinus]|uniref:AsnC family transcriptional regulator n=1 Tax=Streptomyces roseolilacinus TaxID=66904 RepID=A0A918AXJ6_9ACTN|nr:AsnC family transcriptional regulator [Streptomyces roseolilacinus]
MANTGITLDLMDRRIVSALQIDGRAEITRIATVLGTSPRTVSRRLKRLFDARALTVVRMDRTEETVGATVLRIKVLRGKVDTIALAMARRTDVLSVDIVMGGEEITAVVAADSGADRDRLLYRQLPATSAITSTTSHAVLHLFADAAHWRSNLLSPAQTAALTPTPGPVRPVLPDRADRHLLSLLEDDARLPHTTLADRSGLSPSTVRRRLDRLTEAGLLRTHVTIDPGLLGLHVDAGLWLEVPPAHLHTAGQALAAHPYTHAVAATTGPANLIAAVYCRDLGDLYTFTTEVLGSLCITRAETSIIDRRVRPVGAPPV